MATGPPEPGTGARNRLSHGLRRKQPCQHRIGRPPCSRMTPSSPVPSAKPRLPNEVTFWHSEGQNCNTWIGGETVPAGAVATPLRDVCACDSARGPPGRGAEGRPGLPFPRCSGSHRAPRQPAWSLGHPEEPGPARSQGHLPRQPCQGPKGGGRGQGPKGGGRGRRGKPGWRPGRPHFPAPPDCSTMVSFILAVQAPRWLCPTSAVL